jgi:ATP-dependent Lhr-like helicase
LSFSLVRAEREVLLGIDPDVAISERAIKALEEVRGNHDVEVSADGFVVLREGDGVHWWTWAGARANATLIAGLPGIAEDAQRPDNFRIRLRSIEAAENLLAALNELNWDDVLPSVSPAATAGLKFSEVLPPDLAVKTIAERLADHDGAQAVVAEPLVWNVAP